MIFEVLPLNDTVGIPSAALINPNTNPGDLGKILNVIILSKIPDETNVVVNHEKKEGITSAGILFPSNISEDLKGEAGNIIKGLKSQNLI